MHNNYHFLKKLVEELNQLLQGASLMECFSQAKDELFLGFAQAESDFWIKADLSSNFSCLSFPKEMAKSKKGVTPYFKELTNQSVLEVVAFQNERAFRITFSNDWHLVFKLFGNRSNVSLYEGEVGVKSYSKQFHVELERPLSDWNRMLDVSEEKYAEVGGWGKLIPTLGKELALHFDERQSSFTEGLKGIESLGSGGFYIKQTENRPQLTLIEVEGAEWHRSAVNSLTTFYNLYIRIESFEKTQKALIQKQTSRIRQKTKRKAKVEQRLEALLNEQPLNQIADVVMANLHVIPAGAMEVELFDFYTNKQLKVSFKRNQTPQKYAEQLYRKSKNRSKELEVLEDNIGHLEKDIQILNSTLDRIEQAESYRDLKPFIREEKKQEVVEENKFKEYQLQGYQILVGRNSRNNDELTKSAHKEDLWLHAKDVSGSHVIIKTQSGKTTPKTVIEYAASIAAAFSKRKNDSVCPVIVTTRKFVRKLKGAPAGSVVVDREEVVLVEPLKL